MGSTEKIKIERISNLLCGFLGPVQDLVPHESTRIAAYLGIIHQRFRDWSQGSPQPAISPLSFIAPTRISGPTCRRFLFRDRGLDRGRLFRLHFPGSHFGFGRGPAVLLPFSRSAGAICLTTTSSQSTVPAGQ